MDQKVFILIAGVNGAGKTSLFHVDHSIGVAFDFCRSDMFRRLPRINPDEILRDFGDWRDAADRREAGEIAVNQIKDCLSHGRSFSQETTLCGLTVLRNIRTAKANGFKVGIIYVGLASAEIAKARVRARVEKGGHGVSDAQIEKRYSDSFRNLNKILPQCDGVLFYDNTVELQSFALYDGKELQLLTDYEHIPEWFKNNVEIPEISRSHENQTDKPAVKSTSPVVRSAGQRSSSAQKHGSGDGR